MAIPCDVGFDLAIYYYKGGYKEKIVAKLTECLDTLLDHVEEHTVHISENTTYELAFTAQDPKGRLYIEGIDNIAGNYYDTQFEQYYILPSNEPVIWFRWDVSDQGMVPGSYYIKVLCDERWYYGVLKVEPKHMDCTQHQQMKEEVETFLSSWLELPLDRKSVV